MCVSAHLAGFNGDPPQHARAGNAPRKAQPGAYPVHSDETIALVTRSDESGPHEATCQRRRECEEATPRNDRLVAILHPND